MLCNCVGACLKQANFGYIKPGVPHVTIVVDL